jgi:hypothetical protein
VKHLNERVTHRDHGEGFINKIVYFKGKALYRVTWDDAARSAHNSLHPEGDFE